MAIPDEALPRLAHRIGIAHLASSVSVTAYALSSSRLSIDVALGGFVAYALLGLACAAGVFIAHRRAVDLNAKRRAAQPFWWFFGAQASFAAQFTAGIAYMHFTGHILP